MDERGPGTGEDGGVSAQGLGVADVRKGCGEGRGIEKGGDARGQTGPRAKQRRQRPGATALPPQRTLTSDRPLLSLEGERVRTDHMGRAYLHGDTEFSM